MRSFAKRSGVVEKERLALDAIWKAFRVNIVWYKDVDEGGRTVELEMLVGVPLALYQRWIHWKLKYIRQ